MTRICKGNHVPVIRGREPVLTLLAAFLVGSALAFLSPTGVLLPGQVAGASASSEVVAQDKTEGQSDQPASEMRTLEAKITAEQAVPVGARELAIPLRFQAASGETVGKIRVLVAVPQGLGRFRKVELPEDARWKVSTRRRNNERAEKGELLSRATILELTISAGSRAIRDGVIAHLRFSRQEAGTGESAILDVRKIETWPPEPEPVSSGSPESSFPLPADPPLNPAQSCFFYAH